MLLKKTENLPDAPTEQRGTRLSISFFHKFLVEVIGYIFLKKMFKLEKRTMNVKRDYCLVSRRLSCNAFLRAKDGGKVRANETLLRLSWFSLVYCLMFQSVSFHARLCSRPTKVRQTTPLGRRQVWSGVYATTFAKKWGFTTASNLLHFISLLREVHMHVSVFYRKHFLFITEISNNFVF